MEIWNTGEEGSKVLRGRGHGPSPTAINGYQFVRDGENGGRRSLTKPVPLGLKKSFGYGDRLGLATPGHLAANRQFDFAPIFAQQSIRELTRTNRGPAEIIPAAQQALAAADFSGIWGADADHLKTVEDVRVTSEAGFCFFTIDPSDFVENRSDTMTGAEVRQAMKELTASGVWDVDWEGLYVGRKFEINERLTLTFTGEDVARAAVKYGRAILHTAEIAKKIDELRDGQPFEVEVSVDETDSPTSALEHLFYGLELKRRGVKVVSLAPRFVGQFEKGIDYCGDVDRFEESLKEHVAIAAYCGPYKISIHSGSDKFSIYPIIGRACGDLLHVKTAGTSYLEALRCVLRARPDVFSEIAHYCAGRFEADRASYCISTTEDEVRALFRNERRITEKSFLDERPGRQLLHVTFGSVLSEGRASNGCSFKENILRILDQEADLHHELVEAHFVRHLRDLTRG